MTNKLPTHAQRIGRVQDELAEARSFCKALHMMAGSIEDMEQLNAFQIVLDEIDRKFLYARDVLSEIRSDLP